ncbi:MAG: NAD-dependent epimerase/dehydratase family protein, partial [Pseudomonadota bacterium]
TEAILDGRPIEVFNHGNHSRDFTYVSDVVEAVVRVSDRPAVADPAWQAEAPDPGTSNAPFRIYNVGNNAPARLNEYIAALETALGRTANKIMLPLQPGDVPDTYADTTRLRAATEARPSTPIETGVAQFVSWYRKYYRR